MANPKIRIKTKSFGVGSQPIAASSTGTINLYYNLRYACVRALFLSCGGSSTTYSANKLMESVDPTTSNGSIQFSVGGMCIPQNPLSTLNNKATILNELRRAMGSIYDKNNSMSIGASEFIEVVGSATSITVPGKFYVAINTQKLTESQDYMFTGVSSANSQINVIINTSTATTVALTAYLIANYDAIFEIDTLTKQMNYIQ
jgi:Ca2+-binding EF-hand superfamily protein